ncbi:hypothetical protein OS493_033037 [Desmophyllum pertusum]|uniref:Uncharacterized protein n=1 Tax=Desmophyllum pertusum TaxID=174260 RepID=A0A9X0D0K1_9CNID|nr:hypothetical protein OS493_033037 [Desmophyllum pertusum]
MYTFLYTLYQKVHYLLEIRVGNHDEPNLKENSLCGSSFRFKQKAWQRIRCPVPLLGRYVTITRLVDSGNLMLCEVEVREEATEYVKTSMSYPRQRGNISILENEETSLPWRLAGNQGNERKMLKCPLMLLQGFKIKFESVSDDGNNGEINIRDVRLGANPNCTCAPPQACPKLTGYGTAQIVPSSSAFLFSLKPFNTNDAPTKLEVLPEKRQKAIRRHNKKGPCWGEDKDELCFNNNQVNTEINSSGVYNVSGMSDPSTYFCWGAFLPG